MISEKTVELNLTTELINWLWSLTNRVHYAIAPSQRAEGQLGYDTRIRTLGGRSFFVQYKRAYVNGTRWQWHLNRTTRRDQHAKLLALEQSGLPVRYALPFFHTPLEIAQNRRQLLKFTIWRSPSSLPVPGGGVGHHEVNLDAATGNAWLSSDTRIPIDLSTGTPDLLDILRDQPESGNLGSAIDHFNKTFLHSIQDLGGPEAFEDSEWQGLSLVVQPLN